jgi:cyclopropane fatty-acyl-phospholipid synthase-like methyltransferase
MGSGLYEALSRAGMLIEHQELPVVPSWCPAAYKVIEPQVVPFISYPYEWCFSQLRDAALLTLAIQRRALEFNMSLKDASAYNVQFLRGRPVFIDTLSFEQYEEGKPWVAYRQFCQHFLAPLALMSRTDVRLNQLLRIYIDGIPLDLASRLLPGRTRFSLGLGAHVHVHARAQQHYADKPVKPLRLVPGSWFLVPRTKNQELGTKRNSPLAARHSLLRMTRLAMQGLIGSLESTVRRLTWQPAGTEWAKYYDATNYSDQAFAEKQRLVAESLKQINPATVWDLGANTGLFSQIAARQGARTIAFDIDPAAVERNYLDCRKRGEQNVLPLVLDLTNPSPGIGWQHQERRSLVERGPADAILALALLHHLAIGNNLPFAQIADFLARVGQSLVIEFIPKQDSQVQRLLASREDIFPDYTPEHFEAAFAERFQCHGRVRIGDSQRTLYRMTRIADGRNHRGVESSGVQEFRSSTPQLSNSQTPRLS